MSVYPTLVFCSHNKAVVHLKDWIVVAGPSSPEFAHSLAAGLGVGPVDAQATYFPDGESKIRIDAEVAGKSVALVQSLYPPSDTHLLQLLLMAERLTEGGAEVHAVVPYLAYARQDKEFLKGEIVSLNVVMHMFAAAGVRSIATVDIHNAKRLASFPMPGYNYTAVPALAGYVSANFKLDNPIVASPDVGSLTRADAFAAVLGCGKMAFNKSRDRVTGEISMEENVADLRGRDAIIVDDVISTGDTVVKCTQMLKRYGASRVFVACTHPLMVDGASDKLEGAGVDEIIATNTVPNKYSKVDVSGLLVDYLKGL